LNLFHVYLPGHVHLVSMVLAVSSVLLAYRLHPRVHPVYRFMNAMMVCVFAHFMYENIFTFFYRLSGYGVDAGTLAGIKLYWGSTILLGAGLYYSSHLFKFLSMERNATMFLLGILLIASFTLMYQAGWYVELYYWFQGGPDPHNVLWAMSKALGFAVWLPIVKDA